MNPPKFDRVDDMADLTHLSEASVVHNLRLRHSSNFIYTYSGLFLVAVNPYMKLPIYTEQVVQSYKNKKRGEMPPHIYAVTDVAYHDMMQDKENQSILITGESGAGKTENTKKVIQYYASIAPTGDAKGSKTVGHLERQILQANPILEAFGNAQTIRNNNSSRFGKFIRIEFNSAGQIAGGNIEWYLLEKSRIAYQTSQERNYHIFYQLMSGGDHILKEQLLLTGTLDEYAFTKGSNKVIDGVDDAEEFHILKDAMNIMGFTEREQMDFFRVVAAILHLGNIIVAADRGGQAYLKDTSVVEKVCHILGVPIQPFISGLVTPKIKAGREIVTQARSKKQVDYSIEALGKVLYERSFGALVSRINQAIDRGKNKNMFIGVLDIAGFEIFRANSFEQLCINYTNEKLQQFFNHHMFVVEQEEYKREDIDWQFIDYGLNLQPTIDLIEKVNPIGILSLLDEECVMPKATDKTFLSKLNSLWNGKSSKYESLRFKDGFILQHYAAKVEYSTEGWLDKNSDPLNENLTRLLADSTNLFIANLFEDYSSNDTKFDKARMRKGGQFRTVSQRHKEQLTSLMKQLESTNPHFVRCIIPNTEKRPNKMNVPLVLDQLRCNGVLEGIRISRVGFPNRLPFVDFRQRYEVLRPNIIPKGYIDGRKAAKILVEALNLDKDSYRVGNSKMFFRAGILAELEEDRDFTLGKIFTGLQAACRKYIQKRIFRRRLAQSDAIRIIQRNARIYLELREWSWYRLYAKIKPLTNVTRVDRELRAKEDALKELEERQLREEKERQRLAAIQEQLELEKRAIEEQLEIERHLAEENEAILKRTQEREIALQDELREVNEELEKVEIQCDELLRVKKMLELQIQDITEQVQDDAGLIQQLEHDLSAKNMHIQKLEKQLEVEVIEMRNLGSSKKQFEATIEDLQRALEAKEADLTRLQSSMSIRISTLEASLQKATDEKASMKKLYEDIDIEHKLSKDKLFSLTRTTVDYENIVKRKEADVANMSKQLKDELEIRQALELTNRQLQVQLGAADDSTRREKLEREKLLKQIQNSQNELERLRRLMDEKGSEQSKQSEIRRQRETELLELKNRLAAVESDLAQTRSSSAQTIDQLRVEVENEQSKRLAQAKIIPAYEAQVATLMNQVSELKSSQINLSATKQKLEKELVTLKSRSQDLEDTREAIQADKESLERQIVSMTARTEKAEDAVSRHDRESAMLQKQYESLLAEYDEEQARRLASDTSRKKLESELVDIQLRLEVAESAKAELQRLAIRTTQLESLKQANAESQKKVTELEEAKMKIEKELTGWRSKHNQLTTTYSNVEKSKNKLTTENEDLQREIMRHANSSRVYEKTIKQFDLQLANLNKALDQERNQRETSESLFRKLQASNSSLNMQLEEKSRQITNLFRSKSDLEKELKSLIEEVGTSGRHAHELSKAKSRVIELENTLRQQQQSLASAEDGRRRAEEQVSVIRKQLESDFSIREHHLKEAKLMMMKEIQELSETLEHELKEKADISKVYKRLQDEVNMQTMRNIPKSKDSDRKEVETAAREWRSKFESEARLRQHHQDLAVRHEKKANDLQRELENFESQMQGIVRAKRVLEQQIEQLSQNLNDGMELKNSLLAERTRLENENAHLQQLLEEEEEARSAAEALTKRDGSFLDAQTKRELEKKIESLEESRRALMAAQRLAKEDLKDQQNEASNLQMQKKALITEVERLERQVAEIQRAQNDETAEKRELNARMLELQSRLNAETINVAGLTEELSLYKSKATEASNRLANIEMSSSRFEKSESCLRLEVERMEADLQIERDQRLAADEQLRGLKEKLIDMEARAEDDQVDLRDLTISSQQLQAALKDERQRYKKDLEEWEESLEAQRQKYQKELEVLTSEVNEEKARTITLRDENKELRLEIDSLSMQLEDELRGNTSWKKDRERLESRIADLNTAYIATQQEQEKLQNDVMNYLSQVRDLRNKLDEAESKKALLERTNRSLTQRLQESDETYQSGTLGKHSSEKNIAFLQQQLADLRDQVDESRDAAATASEKLSKAEAIVLEAKTEVMTEQHKSSELAREKHAVEKLLREARTQITDLETRVMATQPRSIQRLQEQLEQARALLESRDREKNEILRKARKHELTLKDMNLHLEEKEKIQAQQKDELTKANQKIQEMRNLMDATKGEEEKAARAQRRAEREADDVKNHAQSLQREIERLKFRLERQPPFIPTQGSTHRQ